MFSKAEVEVDVEKVDVWTGRQDSLADRISDKQPDCQVWQAEGVK